MIDRLAGSCHCGAIRLTLPRVPDEVTTCNCTLCAKLGTRWVYFAPHEVQVDGGPLQEYVRADLSEPALGTQRCGMCGCTVTWRAFDPSYARMGVNANLFAAEMIDALPVREVDGLSWAL